MPKRKYKKYERIRVNYLDNLIGDKNENQKIQEIAIGD